MNDDLRLRLSRRHFLRLTSGAALAAATSGCDIGAAGRFRHGVASADPTTEALSFWTQVADASADTPVTLTVARDLVLRDVVATRALVARPESDFTVEARVEGLEPGRVYAFAFSTDEGSVWSELGTARTAPDREDLPVRLAFTCCGSYAHGFFHTYRRIAEQENLTAVVHLGDYIYEYASGVYGARRSYDPPHECVTLEDYRRRYAHYRRDTDVAALHGALPMVVTWDDHELANNAWRGGAIEHDGATEGDWVERREAAAQAHREWLPRFEAHEGSLYRRLALGPLVDLFVLDTRLEGRDAPPRSSAEAEAPGRSLLGELQRERFLADLRASTARWKVVAQSVQLTQHHQDFWNHDAWDGYADERRQLLETIEAEGLSNVFFVCGDGHKSFADDVALDPFGAGYDPATGAGSLATELMTPAAVSPNLFGQEARQLEAVVRERSPHTKFVDAEQRGYWVVELSRERALAELHFVADVETVGGGAERLAAVFEVRDGERHLRQLL
ncbi:MAG: alkaline phosphatase D family protein [Myxococcota bacterium]